MRTSTIAWIIVILLILIGGWYWYSNSSQPAAAPSTAAGINGSPNQGNLGQPDNGQVQQPLSDGAEGSVIGSNLALGTDANSTLGWYLIAYNGMTLYTFTKDSNASSTCYGQCAVNWPPYIVGPEDNVANVKAGVSGKTGTIIRADGSAQMTYNGMPLYFYASDTKSGDTTGQGVNKVWFVAKP
jgi:predicted lipoprotein with Yx(FWY)xxD motif